MMHLHTIRCPEIRLAFQALSRLIVYLKEDRHRNAPMIYARFLP